MVHKILHGYININIYKHIHTHTEATYLSNDYRYIRTCKMLQVRICKMHSFFKKFSKKKPVLPTKCKACLL